MGNIGETHKYSNSNNVINDQLDLINYCVTYTLGLTFS